MAKVQNGVETWLKVSTGCVRRTNVTDDIQTDLQQQIPERNVFHVWVKIKPLFKTCYFDAKDKAIDALLCIRHI